MIYLDYNATTPIDKEVAEAMLPYIYGNYGNPSSNHELGVTAKGAVERAREQVSELINSSPEEIIFTSGGSESNNMVIKGVAYTFNGNGNHIITSQVEHPAILNPCNFLEKLGYKVSYVSVDKYGIVNLSELERLITDKTILVSIMHSNNETGTLQPIEEISKMCKKYGVLLHTDASQSLGKIPVDVTKLGVDFLTIAGHKLYAPKGIGALYIKKGINIEPLIHGAGHENGRRAGTENIIFDVALGKACEIAKKQLNNNEIKLLTDYFYSRLKEKFGEKIHLNGHLENKLPNTLNVSFLGINGHEVLDKLTNVLASTGSACHSGSTSISPVLKAMGVSEEVGRGAVRFSLGRYTTKEEIDFVINEINKTLNY
ncbi:MAG: cysteine desulfurase [Clostridium sp.]|uniref:cysteine desulfurase family protein n=1 Tax=Clostridium sp. TaxID=1506 RepID=UPI0025BA9068|nr:cysteine desulfurase family protein [Clostridium sp.]MCF0149082.1 cysteine desulfurase [Clostridium sp.]